MRYSVLGELCGCLLILAGCSSSEELQEAERAVPRFRQMFEAGRFPQMYEQSAPELKRVTPRAEFIEFLTGVQRKLGTAKMAQRTGFNVRYGTDGTHVTLVYQSRFATGSGVETFVYRTSDSGAKLAGYHVNSHALSHR
jgi:hypothetical protein